MIDNQDLFDIWESIERFIPVKDRNEAAHSFLKCMYDSELITEQDFEDISNINNHIDYAVDKLTEDEGFDDAFEDDEQFT